MVGCLKENVYLVGNECSRLSYFFVQLLCWSSSNWSALDQSTHVGDLQSFSLLRCVNLSTFFSTQPPSQTFREPVIVREMYEVAVSLIQSFDELEMKSNR